MARPIWTGSLGFGLVNVPIGLYAATRDKSIHFHQFEQGTTDRIRYRRVNERTGREVPTDEIVKGFDLGGGEFVVVTDDELEAVVPEGSRSIEITDFVDLHEIDPVYFQTTYYLAPRGEAAGHAYGLLRAAMDGAGKAGIAQFVLRGKEHVVAVRPDREVLALETMYFADEIRDAAEELPDLPDTSFGEKELATAGLLIDSLSAPWDPARYHSTYRGMVGELIERKRHGQTFAAEVATGRPAPVVDLMEALDASLRASRGGRGRATGGPAPRHRARRGSRARPSSTRPAGEDVSGMTKAELMSRAAALGVTGRSRMDRRELEKAVRGAGRRRAS